MPALTSLISFRGLMLACTRKRRIPSHGGDKGHRGDKGPPGDKDDFSGTLKSVFDWELCSTSGFPGEIQKSLSQLMIEDLSGKNLLEVPDKSRIISSPMV